MVELACREHEPEKSLLLDRGHWWPLPLSTPGCVHPEMVIAGIVLAGKSTGHDRWGLAHIHPAGAVGAGSPMIREFQPKQTGHCTGGRTMEQRWSLRKPVTFEVKVMCKCHPMVLGRCRNIGLEGLFIETGIVILPVGSLSEASFHLNSRFKT